MNGQKLRVDGIDWYLSGVPRFLQALCPNHQLRLQTYPKGFSEYSAVNLSCEECAKPYHLPRTLVDEKRYILDKIDSKFFKEMKVLNLDDESVVIAKDEIKIPDSNLYLKARLVESKVGRRIVIYAGEKGRAEKTQIFVEPDIKRLSFDQADQHPSDVFVKVEATFTDGTVTSIEKKIK